MDKRISNIDQIAYVRRLVLRNEKKSLIMIKVGKLSLTLNETNGLDIYDLSYAGDNLAFLSGAGLDKSSELPFSKRFEGGFLYTCGFDSIGVSDGFPLHGSFHLNSAKVTNIDRNISSDKISIIVEGEISMYELFKKNLLVKRRYEFTENSITLTDRIINLGAEKTDIMGLYHFNIGYPMLSEKTYITLDVESIVPRNKNAEARIENLNTFDSPTDANEEAVYVCSCRKDGAKVKVFSPDLNRAISFETASKELKNLMIWKSEKTGDYALGIEPATCHLDNKKTTLVLPNDTVELSVKIHIE